MQKLNVALNNLQWLICHKIKPENQMLETISIKNKQPNIYKYNH